MDVQIETQNVEFPRHAESNLSDRIYKAMSHVAQHVSRMHVTMRDVGGPKGGRDNVCTIRSKLIQGGEVVVVDRGHGAGEAMFGAVHRTKSAINRELKKRRRMKRRGLPHHSDLSNQILMESA